MKKARTYSLIICFTLTVSAFSQTAIVYDSTYLAAIQELRMQLPEYMQKRQIPGLSITVAKKGKLVWSEGFGVHDIENQVPISVNSLFRVGSVFKSITATVLMKMVEEGKIRLDDKIKRYLLDLPSHYDEVTVKQLASHIAGVRHYRDVEKFYRGIDKYGSHWASLNRNPKFKAEILCNKNYSSIEESLELFIKDKLLFEPGSKYRYSTYGYVLLGAVLEKASAKNFHDLVQEVVLNPLAMDHTKPDLNEDNDRNKVSTYVIKKTEIHPTPEVNLSNKWSAGGYVSNTQDLVKFGMEIEKFVDPELFKEMTTEIQLENGLAQKYGIGWKLAEWNSSDGSSEGSIFYHDGFTPGGGAILAVFNNSVVVGIAVNQTSIIGLGEAANIAGFFFD